MELYNVRFIFKRSFLMGICACRTYVNFAIAYFVASRVIKCYIGYRFSEWQMKHSEFLSADIFYQPPRKHRSIDNTQFLLPSVSAASIDIAILLLFTRRLRFPSRPNKISVGQRGNAKAGCVTRSEQHPDVYLSA